MDAEKVNELTTKYTPKLIQIIFTPDKYFNSKKSYSKKEKKDNILFFIIIFVLFIVSSLIINQKDTILQSIITTTIYIFLSITISLICAFRLKIIKEAKFVFCRWISIICLIACILQSICIYTFLKTELYIFYIISFCIILLLQFWVFIYIPINTIKNTKTLIFNIIITFIIASSLNYFLNKGFSYAYNLKYKDSEKTILFQDPVFTETYNENEKILKHLNYYLDVLETLTKYSEDDIKDGRNRNLILQQCDKLIIQGNQIQEDYENLNFHKTKSLYINFLNISKDAQLIKDKFSLMLECNRTQDDFINDLESILSERERYLTNLKDRLIIAEKRLDTISEKYEKRALNNELSEEEKKQFEYECQIIKNEQNSIIELMNEFLNICSLQKDILNKDKYELSILQENNKLYTEILDIVENSINSLNKEISKIDKNRKYLNLRLMFILF